MAIKADSTGWIKLHRQLLTDKAWELPAKQKAIMIALLLSVNHESKSMPCKTGEITVNPGQLITTIPELARLSGSDISIQNVRTFLSQQSKSNFLTELPTELGRLISIVKWDTYNTNQKSSNRAPNRAKAKCQQSDPNVSYYIKERKNKQRKNKTTVELPFLEIINYLNEITGKTFKATSVKTKSQISARWKDGYRLEDFKKVIDNKNKDWRHNSKMTKFLRPETLFGTKFEGYLNEGIKKDGKNDLSSMSRPW